MTPTGICRSCKADAPVQKALGEFVPVICPSCGEITPPCYGCLTRGYHPDCETCPFTTKDKDGQIIRVHFPISWADCSLSQDTFLHESILRSMLPVLPEPLSSVCEKAIEAGYSNMVSDLLSEEVFNYFSAVAPKGCFFGSHPGNGSDIGFWVQEPGSMQYYSLDGDWSEEEDEEDNGWDANEWLDEDSDQED